MNKKLPTVGTSAATTVYCAEKIEGPDGHLWIDGNGKITRANGTLDEPRPNAFSLRAQAVTNQILDNPEFGGSYEDLPQDCPGSTKACRSSCYVGGLEKHARETYDLYEHNSDRIREILADETLASDWAMRLAHWITQNVTSFRWHVSGDVYSMEYARWIRDVCQESPKVEHWIYTRSFQFLAPLMDVSTTRGGNLAINLSCDRDNYGLALRTSRLYVGLNQPRALRLCFLTLDGKVPPKLHENSVVFPDYALRGGTPEGQEWFSELPPNYKAMVCPVDFGGKAENRRCGPCDRCLT